MVPRIKSGIILAILAFVIGFAFVSGAYVAHDLWRKVDDEMVIWLVNRVGAAYAIVIFVVLGFITARAIEYGAIRWWRSRHRPPGAPIDDDD